MVRRVPARLLYAAMLLLAACPPGHAESAAPAGIRVLIVPVARDTMSGVAWRAMTEECSRIWAAEGIALEWSDGAPGVRVVLPLAFDDREVRKLESERDSALGITLFVGRSLRIAVSIPRARQIIGLRRGLAASDDAMTLDIATGVLLGRVVAHEIGHALLLTTSHSAHGLMRAQYDAVDLRPTLPGQFTLSRSERERLAIRFSNEPTPAQLALADITWLDVPPVPSRPHARR